MAILDIQPQSADEPQLVAPKKEGILLPIFIISIIALPVILALWAIVSFDFANILSSGAPTELESQRLMMWGRVINISLSLLGLAALGGVLFVPVIAVINEVLKLFTRKK